MRGWVSRPRGPWASRCARRPHCRSGHRRLAGHLHRLPHGGVPGQGRPRVEHRRGSVGGGRGVGHGLGVDHPERLLARQHEREPLARLRRHVGRVVPALEVRLQVVVALPGRLDLPRSWSDLDALLQVRVQRRVHQHEREQQHAGEHHRPDREQPRARGPAPAPRAGCRAAGVGALPRVAGREAEGRDEDGRADDDGAGTDARRGSGPRAPTTGRPCSRAARSPRRSASRTAGPPDADPGRSGTPGGGGRTWRRFCPGPPPDLARTWGIVARRRPATRG